MRCACLVILEILMAWYLIALLLFVYRFERWRKKLSVHPPLSEGVFFFS